MAEHSRCQPGKPSLQGDIRLVDCEFAVTTDISMGSRDARDVHIGGLMGILVPTVLAGGAGMLVVELSRAQRKRSAGLCI